jgi:hypothetical protein
MRRPLRALLPLAAGLALIAPAGPSPAADDPKAGDAPRPVEPKAADADAPLPVGFPDATRPGAIEVKSYPAYRSAVARGEGLTLDSGDALFWPLFNHIARKEIAMTAPVINTYEGAGLLSEPDARGAVAMEFPYREPDQGEAGRDGDRVTVEDRPAGRYACLGVQGAMTDARMREGVATLRAWLDEHRAEWVESGPPRRLGYHGPMTPTARRLWEVQLPVRPAAEAADPAPDQP